MALKIAQNDYVSFEPNSIGISGSLPLYVSVKSHPDHIDIYREALTNSLRALLDENETKSQRDFWRLFDGFQSEAIDHSKILESISAHARMLFTHEFFYQERRLGKSQPVCELSGREKKSFFVVDGNRRAATQSLDWAVRHQSFLVERPQRFDLLANLSRDISAKAIQRAIIATLQEIESFDAGGSLAGLLEAVTSSLTEKITGSIRLCAKSAHSHRTSTSSTDPTRERVLNFAIHTGNPPPALGLMHPAAGWVLVISTNTQRGCHESISMRQSSRNLRDALLRRNSRSRYNRGARNDARLDRCTQSSRRRRAWIDFPLAECA